jgi:hypothetical protein
MPHVHVLTNSHAATSPRVVREADALAAAGYTVTVSGIWLDPVTAEDDLALAQTGGWTFRAAADLRGGSARVAARATRRAARAVRAAGAPGIHALVYGAHALARAAETVKADTLRLHLEAGLWIAATRAPHLPPWGVDVEDWHSENDPDASPGDPTRRWLGRIEREALHGATNVTTTSAALAAALSSTYGVSTPQVIPNATPAPPLVAPPPPDPPRLIWLSQTVGHGRGLEVLCAALRSLDMPWHLTLVGHADVETRAWVTNALGAMATRVAWQPFVRPWEVDRLMAAHHIALALEIPACRNKDLTASNKLFHGLQGGLRVVATDTAGQREMLAQIRGAVPPVRAGDVEALRTAIASAGEAEMRDPNPLASRAARQAAAAAAFSWPAIASRWVEASARVLSSAHP